MPKVKYPIFKGLHRGQKGFTLIELLIVIAILGIIAAVVVFNVGGFMGAGAEESAKVQLNTLQTAIMAAMADAGCGTTAVGIIGESGTSMTDPSTLTICVTTPATTLATYIVGDILGTWTVGPNGVITAGIYTAGGKNCTWNGHAWTITQSP